MGFDFVLFFVGRDVGCVCVLCVCFFCIFCLFFVVVLLVFFYQCTNKEFRLLLYALIN